MASADEKIYHSLVARRTQLEAKDSLSGDEKRELEEVEASLLSSTDLRSYLRKLAQLRQAEADVEAGNVVSLDDFTASLRRQQGIQE